MHEYSAQDLKKLFNVSESLLRSLVKAGHVNPLAANGKTHYSFQDLLLLKTAAALRAAKIPARKIDGALKKLRKTLPDNASLNALTLSPAGRAITVRTGSSLWDADTGQYVLALESAPKAPSVQPLKPLEASERSLDLAQEHFERGLGLEEQDPPGARAAYSQCLALDAEHTDAKINLGRLLHLAGEFDKAEKIYRAEKQPNPLLSFNLAVLLEDAGREQEAIAVYREAVALDPELADAHFNLARLYEKFGRAQDTLRSLLAYRRLTSVEID